jgi:alkanesulfonate monooxygenase SsuD/methylene tetrahydromethanopterin reductase-like flavin-dependent oxidoreductase (luciferase family)
MKFGLFYEISVPEEVSREEQQAVFHEVVEQAVLAESLGYHSFWTTEHHCLGGFSQASAPEVLYGYVAAKTSKIRIGHGVRLLPAPYNHPIRVAEMAAMVDIMSNGRLEFGTGRSASMVEMGAFGINPSDTRAMWDESLRMVIKMWEDGPYSHDGHYWKIPEREIVPKPMQRPHPPLWMATTSEESHVLAGHYGLGLLSFTIGINFDEVARRIEIYRAAVKQAEPLGKFINNQAGMFVLNFCAATDQEARRLAEDGVMYHNRRQIELLMEMVGPGGLQHHKGYEAYKRYVGVDYDKFTFDYLNDREMILVGSPERCRRILKRYEDGGVDHVLLHVQLHGVSNTEVKESIRLFAKEVMPAFA